MWWIFSALNANDQAILIASLVVFVLFTVGVCRLAYWAASTPFRRMGRKPPSRSILDTIVMDWNGIDRLTLRDMLNGGILILGRPGSGKTSSSYAQLLYKLVQGLFCGGLILSASPSDRELVRKIFAGQEHRLVVVDEHSGHRFNALNFILRACKGSTKDVLKAIEAVFESTCRAGGADKGGDGSYFSDAAKRLVYFAIIVVKHATDGVSPADLISFIVSAAETPQQWHDDAFKETVHYRLMKAAHEKVGKSETEAFDFEAAREYFTLELPKLADRTRSAVVSVAMNTLHPFNTGLNRLLFSTTTTITPKIMDEGKWIFVDMPISRCGEEGGFALGIWKFITEWYVLRRDSRRANVPLFIAVDEFQNTINAYDSHYLAECRKFRSCMIACTQSKASFYANMKGDAAEAKVDALFNNYTHKIFHALGDVQTSTWASELVGSATSYKLGGSEAGSGDLLNRVSGLGEWNGSISEQTELLMQPREFMYGFRTGSAANGNMCDAVLVASGGLFKSNGQGFIKLAIPQL